jgi:hypothetical protein
LVSENNSYQSQKIYFSDLFCLQYLRIWST